MELEHILFRLHNRSSRAIAALLDRPARRLLEYTLLVATFVSLGAFLWLHLHYVGPDVGPQCLLHNIQHAVQTASERPGGSLLRVRVTSARSEALDLLRVAVRKRLAAAKPGNSSPLRVVLPTAMCAASSSTATGWASAQDTDAQSSNLMDALATFLLSRTQSTASTSWAARPSDFSAVPANLHQPVQDVAAAMAATHGGSSIAEQIAARREELAELWQNANSTSDLVSVYQTFISLLVSSRQAHSSITANLSTLAMPWFTAPSEYLSSLYGAGAIDVNSAGAGECTRPQEHGEVSTAPFSWQLEDEVAAVVKPLFTDSDLLVLLTGGARTKLQPEASFLFSFDRGLLTLLPATRDRLGVDLVSVDIRSDSPCVGDSLSRWMMDKVVGYDTAVLNAILSAAHGRGYVLAEGPMGGATGVASATTDVYALSHATEVARFSAGLPLTLLLKGGTLCAAIFLLFSTSSLVSFIAAQTQLRMLKFTMALQQNVRAQLPLLPLVASHLVDSLVFVPIMLGVLFFLFEFFVDQLLAFLVLLVVWACEGWSIVACRTVESLRVFPRVFGLVFTWFHVYYLSYPFGFQYMCLCTSFLALLCCMFHLWNRHELPALLDGLVSATTPRAAFVAQVFSGNAHAAVEAPHQPLSPPGSPVPYGVPPLPVTGTASSTPRRQHLSVTELSHSPRTPPSRPARQRDLPDLDPLPETAAPGSMQGPVATSSSRTRAGMEAGSPDVRGESTPVARLQQIVEAAIQKTESRIGAAVGLTGAEAGEGSARPSRALRGWSP